MRPATQSELRPWNAELARCRVPENVEAHLAGILKSRSTAKNAPRTFQRRVPQHFRITTDPD
jgi:hypothetical protein